MSDKTYPSMEWSADLEHRTGMDEEHCRLANAVDLETYRYVRERVDAVSDTEWELLCSFEALWEDEWTHGIVLEEAVDHKERLPDNALFNPGETISYKAPILYGTPESLSALSGKVFPKRQITSILRMLEYGLVKIEENTPITP